MYIVVDICISGTESVCMYIKDKILYKVTFSTQNKHLNVESLLKIFLPFTNFLNQFFRNILTFLVLEHNLLYIHFLQILYPK